MQILPLNSIHLLNPFAETPVILPAANVGTRNQTGTTNAGAGQASAGQAGSGADHPTISVSHQPGEIQLSFPPGQGDAAEEAAQAVAAAIQETPIELQFRRDEDTGTIVIKLVNQQSGETVQQIPAEALLRLSAALGKAQGRLFDQTA